jgi:hypothetical protein
VVGGDLDQDDPHAVRILDPRLDQAPGLFLRFSQHPDAGCGQAFVLGADIAYL